jgi:hypothetical protein
LLTLIRSTSAPEFVLQNGLSGPVTGNVGLPGLKIGRSDIPPRDQSEL